MNILARAMIDIGKEINRLNEDLGTEKFMRETSESNYKKSAEISEQRQLKILGLTTQFTAAKEEVEKLKKEVAALGEVIKKLKARKKSKK
jgi:polyhydroxyalkanoate synthesis regulator phasin